MKIYRVRYSEFKNEFWVEELTVAKETEKCYFTEDKRRISKAALNTLDDSSFGFEMFMLTVDLEIYRKALLAYYEHKCASAMASVEKYKRCYNLASTCNVIVNEDT